MPLTLKNFNKTTPPIIPLNFTANTANSTVQLQKNGSPTSVTLETSTNGKNWSTYTIGNTITLSNIGDKVYFRNTSTTTTGFTVGDQNKYIFALTGSVACDGDITTLLNKNGTDTITSNFCFCRLFNGCTSLTTTPKLPATTLTPYCYRIMFGGCTGLLSLSELPATTLPEQCYYMMFYGCSNIKLSKTKTGAYQTPYRIPSSGNGSAGNISLGDMFLDTGGTFKGTPSINTTYYTSNTVV